MRTSNKALPKLLAALLAVAFIGLSACGGSDNNATPTATPTATTAPTATTVPATATPTTVPATATPTTVPVATTIPTTIPATAVPTTVTVPGPVAAWPMESGMIIASNKINAVADASTSSTTPACSTCTLTDTLTAGTTTDSLGLSLVAGGKSGNALNMVQGNDSSSDSVTLYNYPQVKAPSASYDFVGSTTITTELWIKPVALPSTYSSTNPAAVIQLIAHTGTNAGYKLYITSDNKLAFQINADSAAIATSTNTINTNVWTHVVGVYDGTNVIVYINGQPEGSVAYSTALASTGSTPTSLKIAGSSTSLPAASTSTSTFNFSGMIDEVRLYNVALTPAQVAARFAQF